MNPLFFLLALAWPSASSAMAESAPPAPEQPALKLEGGSAKLNVLLQPWFVYDSTADSIAKNNFRIRRSEMKLSGNWNPSARWFLMVDPSKSIKEGSISTANDNKILQDLGIGLQIMNGWEIVVGQMKIPTTAEGLDPSADLPLPERSLIGRTLGDKRHLGLQTSYRDTANKDPRWKFTGMISNGGSANADDLTNGKDLYARADFVPFGGFSFGGWAGMPDASYHNISDNGRWGVNLRWKGEKEFARFEHGQSNVTIEGNGKRSHGQTFEAGYLLSPQIQPVARYERYFPNSLKSANGRAITLGMNYFLSGNNQKLQASYSATKSLKGSNGSLSSDPNAESGKVLVLVFQMAI